jgi:hypothetical protein
VSFNTTDNIPGHTDVYTMLLDDLKFLCHLFDDFPDEWRSKRVETAAGYHYAPYKLPDKPRCIQL